MSTNSCHLIDLLKPNDYDLNSRKYRRVRIVVVSDTHEDHRRIQIPDGDILLHCGDFTNCHHWYNLSDNQIPQSLIDFNHWLGELPHQHKIVIGGNHEIGLNKCSKEDIQRNYLTNCIYLKDELIEVEGITIYGCSWGEGEQSKWKSISSHVDVLMTHIPPQYILDLAYQPKESPSKDPCSMCNNSIHGVYRHWGSRRLLNEMIGRIQPRVHCFGHVHDDFGYRSNQFGLDTLFINAAADLTKLTIQFDFYVDLRKEK